MIAGNASVAGERASGGKVEKWRYRKRQKRDEKRQKNERIAAEFEGRTGWNRGRIG